MAHHRGRRDSGVMELALESGWAVAAVMAVTTALVGFWIVPAWFSRSPMFAQLPAMLRPVVWLLFGFFAVTALIKYYQAMRAESKRRLNEYLARDEASHFMKNALSQVESARGTRWRAATPTRLPDEARAADTDIASAWSLELIQSIEWRRFEDLCAEFYREKGIHCETTPLGPDGGIDIRLFQGEGESGNSGVGADGRTTAIVQCKAWGDRLVGVKPVRELLGVMTHEKIPKAFFMTSGSFTDDARSVATANRITLLDGKLFLAMIERLPEASQQSLLAFATQGDYSTPSCPGCGVKMIARDGARGTFWGCPAYPECRHTLQMRAHA
ncbi:MAG: endonuclease [Rhodocyclales bacterium]|nr:endonuclease [Rhodocyclales bacterium]